MIEGEWTHGVVRRVGETRDAATERTSKRMVNDLPPTPPASNVLVPGLNTPQPGQSRVSSQPNPPQLDTYLDLSAPQNLAQQTAVPPPPPPRQSKAGNTKLDKAGMDVAKMEILKKVFNQAGMPTWDVQGSIVTACLDTGARAYLIQGEYPWSLARKRTIFNHLALLRNVAKSLSKGASEIGYGLHIDIWSNESEKDHRTRVSSHLLKKPEYLFMNCVELDSTGQSSVILHFESEVFISVVLHFVWRGGHAHLLESAASLKFAFGTVGASLACCLEESVGGEYHHEGFAMAKFGEFYDYILHIVDDVILNNVLMRARYEALLNCLVAWGNTIFHEASHTNF
ncbi:hypothetical protein SERLA73DRAFT_69023 [Serpula lacrymans var. lacrymans S7.3]|uniref:Uncharacterized protein n=1 Tax=Serpula lacrymans var. lacrymans (strain S7.3) TaxID=936435 RepID=F8PGH5_SERL3|nr:hypothetical protein SERLA73DRAFT_69023 [Serpula lacrymans var. lacrymans S7.3]